MTGRSANVSTIGFWRRSTPSVSAARSTPTSSRCCRGSECFIGIAATRLDSPAARNELLTLCTGRQLSGGVVLHGGFFLGPRGFYAALRDLSESERRQFCMGGVAFLNQLDGADQALKIAQRRDARFVNSCMM